MRVQLFWVSTLQAVLARRLVVGEVYDIMGRVQTLLVRAHAGAVRQVASAVRLSDTESLFRYICTLVHFSASLFISSSRCRMENLLDTGRRQPR